MLLNCRKRCGLSIAALFCLSALAGNAKAQTAVRPEIDQLQEILNSVARGDSAFGPNVAPAETLATTQAAAERVRDLNIRLLDELNQITTVFNNTDEAGKQAATYEAVQSFDTQTAADGASRVFEGEGPSLSIMRQFLIVPAASLGAEPIKKAMAIVTSFERSPKIEDSYFEYTDPKNPSASQILALPGSATSWNKAAQPSMEDQQLYMLKKCRSIPILGWYCNTSWYEPLPLNGGAEALITTLYPLPKGTDNPYFNDGRAENIVSGYTSVYLVEQSGEQVLIYSLGFQIKQKAALQQSRLNAGHKAEFQMLASRFSGTHPN